MSYPPNSDASPKEFSAYTDKVNNDVNMALDKLLSNSQYNAGEVSNWIDAVTTRVLENLQEMSGDFKYIVSVVILQKSHAGFHLFSTCYWDQSTDGTVTVRWENKSMHCVVSVYGVAL